MTDSLSGSEREAVDWAAALAVHDRWLRTVVAARLGERQAIDEVMQEVSLAALRQQAPLADPSKVAPWLYRLAVRQTLLYRRKMGRRRKLLDRYARRVESDGHRRTSDPLDWLLADERQKRVRQSMGQLETRDAEILLLKYTENWSYRQLAQHLGVSGAAIESRLHRARARLRERLTAMEVTMEAISK